jgi:hypothetical protein
MFSLGLLLSLFLSGCLEAEKVGLSYHAYNHTDKSIVSIVINGEGGILGASAHGEGSGVCCVVLPQKWHPGLMATIKWQEDDIPIFNPDGTRKIIDGIPASNESPWKERTEEVPKYGFDELDRGTFYIHFFPNDEVKVLVATRWAGFEGHPYPHPDGTYQQP